MKKIISFCIYGNNPKYAQAAIKNALLQPTVYPDWVCRFYVDDTVPSEVIHELENLGSEIVMCNDNYKGHLKMFRRFEPLKDTTIERFIVRDTDSRLNEREAEAVKEWINSGKEFHIMRDHEQHAALICGGMWGATQEFIQKEKDLFDKEVEQHIKNIPFNQLNGARGYGFNQDQPYLWKYIWPKIINTHIAHVKKDVSKLKILGNEKYFSLENKDGSFIGQPFDE